MAVSCNYYTHHLKSVNTSDEQAKQGVLCSLSSANEIHMSTGLAHGKYI